MGRPPPELPALVARLLADSLRRYRACLTLLLPALLLLVVPLKIGLSTVNRAVPAPADYLPATLFALQLTVISILISYAFLPRAARTLRPEPPLPGDFDILRRRWSLLAASLLLVGVSFIFGPGPYTLPAAAMAVLFFASWPWVRSQAILGYRLLRQGVRYWRRLSLPERVTVALAFVLAQAAPLALGQGAALAVGALGGLKVAWAAQVVLAAGLLPLHLLILVTLGASLSPSQAT